MLNLINEERVRNDVEPLELNTNPIAQDHAESILETDEYRHNPNLPNTMGENINYFTSKKELMREVLAC